MEFINHISYSVFFVKCAAARAARWIGVCALLVAAAGLARFNSRPVRAKQEVPRQEKAAVERLKAGGGYASLAQALLADGAHAPYPSTIDPLLTQRQKLMAVDGAASNYFGRAAAFSSDTLVIGAPDNNGIADDEGSAYVFTRSGATWTMQQKLSAQDGAANSGFGFSIAVRGDTVVIGAPLDDVGANRDQGSAYVFTRSGTVWTQRQKLIALDRAAKSGFGFSVAVSGDTVVIGAPLDDVGANRDQGSAYVFTRSGTVWTQQQKLIVQDGAADDVFGGSVAIDGDTVVVGENFDKVGANEPHGSAYVFTRNGTVWSQQQKLTAADGADGDFFGRSVAVSGDTVVVGAPDDDIGANFDQGSAYVFTRSGAVWTLRQKLTADDGAAVDFFGSAVALSGDTLVVGAENDKIGGNVGFLGQGSAYVFSRSGTVWTQRQKLIAADGAADDRFGSAVAISGDTVVVGAPLNDINANPDQGSVYIFVNATSQTPPVACVSAASFIGTSLATESIVAAFGGELAQSTEAATTQPLPATLAGTQVSVLDNLGTERFAPLFFVSPTQINFQVPPGTAVGRVLVTIIQDGKTVAADSPQIEMVSPGLFSANASGQGLLLGFALRVKADGSQSFEPVVRFDDEKHQFVSTPIDLGSETDQVFLALFATGLRNRSSLGAVSVKIGGVNADVLYAGPQGSFVGLDQLNILLPRSLAGRGEVDVNVTVDAVAANNLKVAIK